MHELQQYIILPVLIAAVIMDFKSFKISNRLILAGLGLGLLLHLPYTVEGFFSVLWNISFPVISLYLFYLVGALGAGDVKLFSVIGAFVNFKTLVMSIAMAMVVGAVVSFVRMLRNGQFFAQLKQGFSQLWIRSMGQEKPGISVRDPKRIIHFSMPILIGTVGAMGYERFFL